MRWFNNSRQNDMWRHLLFLCETMPISYIYILEKTVNLSKMFEEHIFIHRYILHMLFQQNLDYLVIPCELHLAVPFIPSVNMASILLIEILPP